MTIRQPAVAGLFYPASGTTLHDTVSSFLATESSTVPSLLPKVLVVPHAGYIYSGDIAGSAYKLLKQLRHIVRRVVLLGPSHHHYFKGLALSACDSFQTPLGTIAIDQDARKQLLALPQVQTLETAHMREHSLEVQLPFLQQSLEHFTLVPLVVGESAATAVAEVLEMLWGGDETLVVISSDLSHYLPYRDAQMHDAATVTTIEQLQPVLTGDMACGCHPLNGLLKLAQQKRLAVTTLDIRNSGDTAGDKTRVVGYGAFALCSPPVPSNR